MRVAILSPDNACIRPLMDELRKSRLDILGGVFNRLDYDNMIELDAKGLLCKVGEDACDYLEGLPDGVVISMTYEEIEDRTSIFPILRGNFSIIHAFYKNIFRHHLNSRLISSKHPLTLDVSVSRQATAAIERSIFHYKKLLQYVDSLAIDPENPDFDSLEKFLGFRIPPWEDEFRIDDLVSNWKEFA